MKNLTRIFIAPMALYALSRGLRNRRWNRLSRLVDFYNRWWFGCMLPGSAQIGEGTRLGYGGLGIVIHKDARLGKRVNVGPGVVIGGNGKAVGVPTIGDDVVLGAGAKVLGPVVIGDNVHVGANVAVITDVPSNATAVGVPARILTKLGQA